MILSSGMERLFHYALGLKEIDPPHIDDASELLDYQLDDQQLSQICESPIEGLRMKLIRELEDIDVELPSNSCGWIRELLGIGEEK